MCCPTFAARCRKQHAGMRALPQLLRRTGRSFFPRSIGFQTAQPDKGQRGMRLEDSILKTRAHLRSRAGPEIPPPLSGWQCAGAGEDQSRLLKALSRRGPSDYSCSVAAGVVRMCHPAQSLRERAIKCRSTSREVRTSLGASLAIAPLPDRRGPSDYPAASQQA